MRLRIRTIKPTFWSHSGLFRAEAASNGLPIRLFFIGLWCVADREGRFRWDPLQLKALILPYNLLLEEDVETMLKALEDLGSVERYQADGKDYGCITSWHKHQVLNNREGKSELPEPPRASDASGTRDARGFATSVTRGGDLTESESDSLTPLIPAPVEGKGREGKGTGREGNDATVSPSASPSVPEDPVTIEQAWSYAQSIPVTPPWTQAAVEYWHNERAMAGWRRRGGDGLKIDGANWRKDLANSGTWAISAVAVQVAAQRTQQRETEKKSEGGLFASAKAPDLPLIALQRYRYGKGEPMDWQDMPDAVRAELLKAWDEQNDAEKAAMWKKEESRKEEAA